MNQAKVFSPGDRVAYVPLHSRGNASHPDVEFGTVSSCGGVGNVFVRFDKQVQKLGWDGTTSQSCDACNLVHIVDTIMQEVESLTKNS